MLKLILEPVSHPHLEPIVIEDALFAIGRREPPFAGDASGSAARLSRRHARIFVERGLAYIADLGSLNGTQLNGTPLGREAAVLNPGDEIGLGGEYTFRVDVQADDTGDRTVGDTVATRLVLRPVQPDGGLETIVIERFPFLVNRSDELFAQYLDRYPDDVRRISRRQAVILEKGDGIFVEDLDSANGTFVGGERLDEQARPLEEGDVLAFGGDRFAYRVSIDRYDVTEGQDATMFVAAATAGGEAAPGTGGPGCPRPEEVDHTRFVDSATSFLDVFCAEEPERDALSAAEAARPVPAPRGPARQLLDALELGNGRSYRTVAWSVAGLVLVAAVLTGVYVAGSERRAIKTALDDGDYAASAAAAQVYLERHPGDADVGRWGTEAVVRAVLPGWMRSLEDGRFDDARERVARATREHPAVAGAGEMLGLLDWAVRLREYEEQRGGRGAPMSILGDTRVIESLVAEWDANRFRNRQLLTQASIWEPGFEELGSGLVSSLRALRRDQATYGADIAALTNAVGNALERGELARIEPLLAAFQAEHPQLAGVDELRADVEAYGRLRESAAKDPVGFAAAVDAVRFRTELVRGQADRWLTTVALPEEVVAAYRRSRSAWQSGDLRGAVAALEPLVPGPHGDRAQRTIERYQRVRDSFDALQASREATDYDARVAAFRADLVPEEDAFFIEATEADYRQYLARLEDELEVRRRSAEEAWGRFKNGGGLPSMVRVEDGVSERFLRQAELLSRAHAELSDGARAWRSIGRSPPPQWQALTVAVENEIKRQRSALEDLSLVLEPALLQAKLERLPNVED